MRVGTLVLRFHVPLSQSLKSKRAALRPFVEHLRRRHNVSVAEVEDQNLWQSAVLAVAAVSSDERGVRSMLEAVRKDAENAREMDLTDDFLEVF